MKCLVTGAAGFIGSQLVERLLSRGDAVCAVDSFTDYYDVRQKMTNVDSASKHPEYEFVRADVGSAEVVERLTDVDVVFHLAGQPGVRLSWDLKFTTYVERNVVATQKLLEASKLVNVSRFVYASSSSIYGNQPSYPCSEGALPAPFSPYGVTKLAAEHLCRLYAQNYGTPTASLRYFTVYGPRQRPDMAFSKFIRSALDGKPVGVTGDGEQVRDFTFVDDVVDATIAAGIADVPPGRVFNVCGGESVTVNQVIGVISETIGSDVLVEYGPALAGDVSQTGGSSALAAKELNWSPKTAVADGVARQVAWEMARR